MWLATLEELNEDLARLAAPATRALGQFPTEYRVGYYIPGDPTLKIITPSFRFVRALVYGGIVREVRVAFDDPATGGPVLEGRNRLLPAMTEREAVEFIAWKDIPSGVNHIRTITTDDLPRINGSIDAARRFRNAWRLQ